MTARLPTLFVVALLSFTSFAQEGLSPPPLTSANEDNPSGVRGASTPIDTRVRLAGTLLGGAAGTAAGGTIGGLFSMGRLTSCGSFPATIHCGQSLIPIFIGMAGGSGIGVFATGRALGSNGDFALSVLGGGLGTVVVALMTGDNAPGEPLVTEGGTHIVLSLLIPTVGALLLNELSHRFSGGGLSARSPRRDEGLLVAPTVGASRDGGFAGLVGRF
ncbi:hypothetical protein [Myxococcus sp. CA040A]|uniref:hypothetical protein n=1 Tax=Myxococcus sp. CA040A TaxID=2741738 RepID=UPI00157A8041|nr:hypothetical protein [Myxococcus sp. CA040A]NTX08393.1 hypothetical protein [Myxococcus sp. CA040A]